MNDKYFTYDPDQGFETHPTADEAKQSAEDCLDYYRDNAGDGWGEDVQNVCWGVLSEHSVEIGTGQMVDFEGENVEAVDFKLVDLQQTPRITINQINTGLCDSNGTPISVGDKLKKPVDCNRELHGEWAVYEVIQRGLTPVISYLYSEKGKVLPEGYLASPLCSEYDGKMFCFARDLQALRPTDEGMVLVDNTTKQE